MRARWTQIGVVLSLALLFMACAGWGEEEADERYDGGYLRFSYRTETASGLQETIATEIIPLEDGRFRVSTTTEQITGLREIRLGFFGGSFHWLGLYAGEQEGDRLDLSDLDALSSQELEPDRRYLLPDGGLLQTSARVTVAGLSGIEGVFTCDGAEGVTVRVVLAEDRMLRQLLPFPLEVEITCEDRSEGGEDAVAATWDPGTIRLVESSRTPDGEELP